MPIADNVDPWFENIDTDIGIAEKWTIEKPKKSWTKEDWAIAYAAKGYLVFPLPPNGKKTLLKGGKGFYDATTDPLTIAYWWSYFPNANIGVYARGSNVIVIDADRHLDNNGKEKADGVKAFEALKGEHSFDGPAASTSGGGRHFVYSAANLEKGKTVSMRRLPEGIDIKWNGYIAVEPSRKGGKMYRWDDGRSPLDVEPPPLPDWLRELIIVDERTRSSVSTNEDCDDSEYNQKRYTDLLLEKGRTNSRYNTACIAYDYGLSQEVTGDLLLKHYNEKCDDFWSEEHLRDVVDHAYLYAKGAFGNQNSKLTDFADFNAGTSESTEYSSATSEQNNQIDFDNRAKKLQDMDFGPGAELGQEEQEKRSFKKKLDYSSCPSVQGERDLARRAQIGLGGDVIFCRNHFWRWNNKFWESLDDIIVKGRISDVMEWEGRHSQITGSKVGSILDLMKSLCAQSNSIFDTECEAVVCENGELDYDEDTGWILRHHNKSHYHQTVLPVKYTYGATAPRFERYLQEVFDGDPDSDHKIKLALQFLGFCLTHGYRWHKFLLLLGEGRNGKSVYLEILQGLLGRANYCSVDPSQFDNQFQLAYMAGKMANIVAELRARHDITDDKLKLLTSGGEVTAEEKHKPAFTFTSSAKHAYAANTLPPTKDTTLAFRKRAILLEFNNTFLEHADDTKSRVKKAELDLSKTIIEEELPGVLNMALEALAGLYRDGKFCEPPSGERRKDEWFLQYDAIAQFAAVCEFGPEFKVSKSTFFKQYREWAESVNLKNLFTMRNLIAKFKERYKVTDGRGTKGVKMLFGIGLSGEKMKEEEIHDVRRADRIEIDGQSQEAEETDIANKKAIEEEWAELPKEI